MLVLPRRAGRGRSTSLPVTDGVGSICSWWWIPGATRPRSGRATTPAPAPTSPSRRRSIRLEVPGRGPPISPVGRIASANRRLLSIRRADQPQSGQSALRAAQSSNLPPRSGGRAHAARFTRPGSGLDHGALHVSGQIRLYRRLPARLIIRGAQVRVLPAPLCDVPRHRRQMSRDIVDTSAPSERLVVAARVEHQTADQLTRSGVEDADVAIGDEQLDQPSLVSATEPDVVEP